MQFINRGGTFQKGDSSIGNLKAAPLQEQLFKII